MMTYFLSYLLFIPTVFSHIYLVDPPARGSFGYSDLTLYPPFSYTMRTQIAFDERGAQGGFPCHNRTASGPVQRQWKAGHSYYVYLKVVSWHQGGHCQFSLDCTGGVKDFIVIKSILDTCLLERGDDVETVTIPEGANGKCTFAWSYIAKGANDQYYMSCTDVEIEGPPAGSFEGNPLAIAGIPSIGYPESPIGAKAPYDKNGRLTNPKNAQGGSIDMKKFDGKIRKVVKVSGSNNPRQATSLAPQQRTDSKARVASRSAATAPPAIAPPVASRSAATVPRLVKRSIPKMRQPKDRQTLGPKSGDFSDIEIVSKESYKELFSDTSACYEEVTHCNGNACDVVFRRSCIFSTKSIGQSLSDLARSASNMKCYDKIARCANKKCEAPLYRKCDLRQYDGNTGKVKLVV
jgi:hypothetical protein